MPLRLWVSSFECVWVSGEKGLCFCVCGFLAELKLRGYVFVIEVAVLFSVFHCKGNRIKKTTLVGF